MTPQQYFSRLAAEGFVPTLQGVRATVGFQIQDAGEWRVRVDNGAIEIEEGPGAADGTLRSDTADFVDVVLGRRHALTALMQGRLSYRGPIVHLIHLSELLALGPVLAETPLAGDVGAGGEAHP